MGKSLALSLADLYLMLYTLYVQLSPPGVIIEYRSYSKPWTKLEVAYTQMKNNDITQKNKNLDNGEYDEDMLYFSISPRK